jgi:hypothetical protein
MCESIRYITPQSRKRIKTYTPIIIKNCRVKFNPASAKNLLDLGPIEPAEALACIGAAGFAAIPQPRAELRWSSG